jgi:phosphate starvation-inducible protein PhoH
MVGNQLEYNKELTLASVACAVAERAPNQLYRIISRRAAVDLEREAFLPGAIAFTLLAHL